MREVRGTETEGSRVHTYLLVQLDLPVQNLRSESVKVFDLLRMVRLKLGHRRIQHCLATCYDICVFLYTSSLSTCALRNRRVNNTDKTRLCCLVVPYQSRPVRIDYALPIQFVQHGLVKMTRRRKHERTAYILEGCAIDLRPSCVINCVRRACTKVRSLRNYIECEDNQQLTWSSYRSATLCNASLVFCIAFVSLRQSARGESHTSARVDRGFVRTWTYLRSLRASTTRRLR